MPIFLGLSALAFSGMIALIYAGRVKLPSTSSAVPVGVLRLLPVVFVLANLLYVFPVVLQLLLENVDHSKFAGFYDYREYFPHALGLNAVFLITFTLLFNATLNSCKGRLISRAAIKELPRSVFWFIWLLFFVVCVYMILSLAGGAGGIVNFILLGYGVTKEFNTDSAAVAGLPWLAAILLLNLADAKAHKSRIRLIFILILMTVLVLSLFIMGRRGALVGIGVAFLVVYHFQFKRLSFKALFLILSLGFLLMNVVGLIRGNSYSNFESAVSTLSNRFETVQESGNMDLFYTLTKGNFVAPFQSMPNIIANAGGSVEYQFGGATLKGFTLFIPQAVWRERPEALSNWYMREFIDSSASDNEGLQFFFLSGSYLDFGVFGSLLWGVLYGTGLAVISVWFVRRLHNPVYLTLLALFVGNMLNFISSDTVGGVVVFMKSSAAPCLSIILLSLLVGYRPRSGGSNG